MGAVAVDTGFPVDVLEGCETALVVFAAAFGGEQDAKFIRDAGLLADCLDNDHAALSRMMSDYPDTWNFWSWDVSKFLDCVRGCWDVVTLDPWTGDLMDQTIERLPDFCKLARRFVIVGTDSRRIDPPDGWRIRSKFWRSDLKGGIYWAVLARDGGLR